MKKKRGAVDTLSVIICIAVLVVYSVISFAFVPVVGMIQLLAVALLAVLCALLDKKKRTDAAFSAQVLKSYEAAPVPVVLYDEDGAILWCNRAFAQLIPKEERDQKTVPQIFSEIDASLLFSGDRIDASCYVCEKHCKIVGNIVKNDDGAFEYAALYLYDEASVFAGSDLYELERPVIGVINIDNYDDVLVNTPASQRSTLISQVESKIYSWFSPTKGIIKKLERDRYMVLFQHRFLDEMINDKFPILDSVKEIKCGNKFSATLSIGIGVSTDNFLVCEDYANAAITLALGRGGDQAVIKDKNEVQYFGGRSREHEKTTKVKARVTALALRELVEHASDVMIMGHQYPDMDSIGASVGVAAYVRYLGKNATIIYEYDNSSVNSIAERIKEKTEYDGVFITRQQALERIQKETLLIVVDTHRPVYTLCPELLYGGNDTVVMDHHRRGADFIENTKLIYHEPYASSTSELVAELLQYAGENFALKSPEAEALYAGIMMDTKDFAMKTGVRTFEAAAYLKRCGVDIAAIRRFFRNDFTSYVQVAQVVSNAQMVHDNIAISKFQPEDGVDMRVVAPQAADKLLSISGIEASFVIMLLKDETSISGRSTGNINVQVILEKLGGGGHQTMAGAQLSPCTYEEAKEQLEQAINEYYSELEE